MKNIDQYLAKIELSYANKLSAIVALEQQQKDLIKLGIEYGSPSFKKSKYLRIIGPSVNGSKRVFTYIGADKEKQKKALDALMRGEQYKIISLDLKRVKEELNYIYSHLSRLEYVL